MQGFLKQERVGCITTTKLTDGLYRIQLRPVAPSVEVIKHPGEIGAPVGELLQYRLTGILNAVVRITVRIYFRDLATRKLRVLIAAL